MTRLHRKVVTAITLVGLTALVGCDRQPEPTTPPATPAASAPTPAPVPAAVPLPESAPVVESMPVETKGTPRRAPVPPPLPAGFVQVAAGDWTGSDGQVLRIPAFAIARKAVTVGELRAWAEAGGGRRLPQLGDDPAAVATDLDWLAAEAYVRWLADKEKRPYRLAREGEWLRAAKSGQIDTQSQRAPSEPPLWEWTGDCWNDGQQSVATAGSCGSRVLVGGELPAAGPWGRAPMGERRPAAAFRIVLELP